MSLALLFHYLMLYMFLMLIHPSSGACDLFVELFHGLYCSVRIEVDASNQVCVSSYIRHQNMCRKHYQKHTTRKENSITIRHCTSHICRSTLSQTTTHITTNTRHYISTIMHQPLSLQNNTTHEITQQISRKLLRMDVLTSEAC